MAERRTQAEIQRQTRHVFMVGGGVVFFAVGAALILGAFLQDTSGQLSSDDPVSTQAVATTTAVTTVAPANDAAPRSLALVATGDLLAQGLVNEDAAENGERSGARYDFRPMFAE
ncbi:MAG TPA: hypothetical protein VFX21_17030, partial [Acidimicrobiia bacterium]|nr:hypothetical protein [Acidimicrobiia bacterium]